MRKTSFIEFYGLPGSGKSTLSHIVAERLRSEGLSVDEPSYNIDHQHPLPKKLKKFAVGGYWFVIRHRQYRLISEIVKQNGYKGLTAFTMTVNVIQKMRIYNSLKETEIVIMDQGLIQACVSLSTNGKIRAKENYERLLTMMPNAANASKIYIDVNDETALDRMSQRATNDSRVEKLKDVDAKKEMLNRIRCEMTHLRELWEDSGNDIVIVSSNDLKEDIDATYDAITKTLNEKNYKK